MAVKSAKEAVDNFAAHFRETLSCVSGGHVLVFAEDKSYKAKTREYSYRLVSEEDIAASDVVAYHWHPNDSALRSPHLHVADVPRVHFPTSRVSLEDFIMMLTKYYDVRPRFMNSEWTAILDKNKATFEKYATWKIRHPSLGFPPSRLGISCSH